MHRRLGEPLPLQPANAPQVHLHAGLLSPFPKRRCLLFAHPVSASVSRSSPAHAGRFPTCYSPVRHSYPKISVRLACIRHAASVHPEPGSNSPFDIDSFFLFSVICLDCFSGVSRNRRDFCFSRTCTIVFFFPVKFSKIVPALKLSASTLTHITMDELFCQHFFQYFLNIFGGQLKWVLGLKACLYYSS